MIARNVRLGILRRAREILGVKDNWGKKYLRQFDKDGAPRYCVLGAIEQAAYDTGYLELDESRAFSEITAKGLGYRLGRELSLDIYAKERYGLTAWRVNDGRGYEETLRMLDAYIVEVEEGRA